MTRPYCSWHAEPGKPLRYGAGLLRGGQPVQLLGGTIIWQGPAQTIRWLKALPVSPPVGNEKPWAHLTISPPPWIEQSSDAWGETLRLTLEAIGFPPKALPWIAFAHSPHPGDEGVDHAHMIFLPMTFSGRWLDCSNMKQRCDNAETALLHHFSIQTAPRPPLALKLPQRRQLTPAHSHIAAALDDVFRRDQPTGLEQLRTALWERAEVEVELTPNSHGVRSYAFR